MTINTMGNARKHKKKWTRYDARGILTPLERQKLKNGTWRYDRHLRLKVRVKTFKALFEDLPLILNNLSPQDFISEVGYSRSAIPPIRKFIKSLLLCHFRLEQYAIMDERVKKKQKLKVAFREAWQPVNEIIREAKREIQKSKKQL